MPSGKDVRQRVGGGEHLSLRYQSTSQEGKGIDKRMAKAWKENIAIATGMQHEPDVGSGHVSLYYLAKIGPIFHLMSHGKSNAFTKVFTNSCLHLF